MWSCLEGAAGGPAGSGCVISHTFLTTQIIYAKEEAIVFQTWKHHKLATLACAQRTGRLEVVEETDASDPEGSSLKARRGVFQCDATQRVNRGRSGGGAGGAELVEARARGDNLPCNDLPEDGGEEDAVYAIVAGAGDLGQGVAGDGDDGRRQPSGGVEVADLRGSQFTRGGGEVDAVGGCGDGDVQAGVEQELCGGGERFEEVSGEGCQPCGGQILFAELDEVDAGRGPAGGLFDERGLLAVVVAGEEGAACNGVTEHLILSVWC
jgi:hypothetical protein